MRKHLYASAAVALVAAMTAPACDSSGGDYAYGGSSGYYGGCGQYTSCGACTPVSGCGWCQTGVGEGKCADDPNDCAQAPAFSWTWNPSGCFGVVADASVASTDAGPGTSTAVVDAGSDADAAPVESGASVSVDAQLPH